MHRRRTRTLLRLTNSWRLPMATKVVPVAFTRAVGGDALADVLARGEVAMGETSAEVRGAEVGDVLVLRGARFAPREFTVGAIVSDQFVDSGDLMIGLDTATARLGVPSVSRVTITGITSPAKVLAGLRSRGVTIGAQWRLRTSWDPPNPDGTLGLATVKKLLGEVTFRPSGGSAVAIDPAWANDNIAWKRRYDGVALYHNCHRTVAEALQRALREIASLGLARGVDVANTNRYGGCLTTRYNRSGGAFPSLSRHALGMAVDLNPSTNAQGATPTIDCRIVRVMRKHGFAWGGNFWPPDGMHFEWVAEPRHEIGHDSRWCPNLVAAPTTTLPVFSSTTSTTSTTVTVSTTTTTPTSTTLDPANGVTTSTGVPPAATTSSVASGP